MGALPGTHVVVVGVRMAPDTVVPVLGIVKEITVDFAYAYRPAEFARSLARLADGTVDPRAMVTAGVGLDEAADACQALRQPERHAKILVGARRDRTGAPDG